MKIHVNCHRCKNEFATLFYEESEWMGQIGDPSNIKQTVATRRIECRVCLFGNDIIVEDGNRTLIEIIFP